MSQKNEKIASLQTLRGLSIFAVFLLHTAVGEVLVILLGIRKGYNSGWLGVEFFFVISGFVVTMSLHRTGFHVGSFYVKRLFRLMPSMILTAAFGVGVTLYLRSEFPQWPHDSKPPPDVWTQAAIAINGLATFITWRSLPGIFSFQHMWSLSVEEQFYASIGIVCLLLDLFSRKRPKVTLAALGIGSLLLGVSIAMVRISISSQPPPYVPPKGLLPYLAEFRFDFLCAGVFLYWAYDTFNLRFAPRAWLSVVLFIAAVGPFVWFGKIGHPHEVYVIKKFARTGYPLAMLSFSTAVLLAASDISWIPRDSIVYRTLLYLGERSYLIYLFHIPLTAVAWMIMAWGFPNTIVSGAAAYAMVLFLFTAMLTLPLVEVLHRYVETPFIHVGARLSKRVFKVRSSEPIAGDAADPIKKSTDRPPETVESVQWNRAPSLLRGGDEGRLGKPRRQH